MLKYYDSLVISEIPSNSLDEKILSHAELGRKPDNEERIGPIRHHDSTSD